MFGSIDPRSVVDITNEPKPDPSNPQTENGGENLEQGPQPYSARDDASNLADEERAFARSQQQHTSRSRFHLHKNGNGNGDEDTAEDDTELQTRSGSGSITPDSSSYVKRKTSQFLDVLRGGQSRDSASLSPQLQALIDGYAASDIAASMRTEVDAAVERRPEDELPNVVEENRLLRGRRGASWLTQFRILSGRAFKNLYRNPALLTAHYLSSIALACKDFLAALRLLTPSDAFTQ